MSHEAMRPSAQRLDEIRRMVEMCEAKGIGEPWTSAARDLLNELAIVNSDRNELAEALRKWGRLTESEDP